MAYTTNTLTPTRYTSELGPPQRMLNPPDEKVLTALYILLGVDCLSDIQLKYETVKKELSGINPEIKFLKFDFDDEGPSHSICYFNMGDFYFFMNRGDGQQEECRMLCYKKLTGIFHERDGTIHTKSIRISDQMKNHIASLFGFGGKFIETEEDLCSADPMGKLVISLLNLTFKPQKYGNCMAANFFSLLKVLKVCEHYQLTGENILSSRDPTLRFNTVRALIKREKINWIRKILSEAFYTPENMSQSMHDIIVELQEKSDRKQKEGDGVGVEHLEQIIQILEKNLAQTTPIQSLGERAKSPVSIAVGL